MSARVMGKRFVTRSRQEWEALMQRDVTNANQVQTSASAWLADRLEGYVQSNPESPITLAVPDRFSAILGDTPDEAKAKSRSGKS